MLGAVAFNPLRRRSRRTHTTARTNERTAKHGKLHHPLACDSCVRVLSVCLVCVRTRVRTSLHVAVTVTLVAPACARLNTGAGVRPGALVHMEAGLLQLSVDE